MNFILSFGGAAIKDKGKKCRIAPILGTDYVWNLVLGIDIITVLYTWEQFGHQKSSQGSQEVRFLPNGEALAG